jgi:hypothetical protein
MNYRIDFVFWELAICCIVPPRRLEDRIRELCAKAVAAQTEEADLVIQKLKAALHEHNQRLRKLAARELTFQK